MADNSIRTSEEIEEQKRQKLYEKIAKKYARPDAPASVRESKSKEDGTIADDHTHEDGQLTSSEMHKNNKKLLRLSVSSYHDYRTDIIHIIRPMSSKLRLFVYSPTEFSQLS